jgi:hypothetical protein
MKTYPATFYTACDYAEHSIRAKSAEQALTSRFGSSPFRPILDVALCAVRCVMWYLPSIYRCRIPPCISGVAA